MTPTAADVPYKYDVVVTGVSGVTDFGLCFADSIESSLPFRTHRAIYDISQTFVERQNVANSYGDNAQDFFLTARQRNWSLGEQQKYFRTGQDGRYWMGSNVNISTPGQVTLSPSAPSISLAATAVCGAREGNSQNVLVASATNLYRVDAAGTVTDLGAHSVGSSPGQFCMATDGDNTYISSGDPSVGTVRKWNGSTFASFSATSSVALAYLNNTLYGIQGGISPSSGRTLLSYSSTGTPTSLFTWKNADGAVGGGLQQKIEPFGGKLLILFRFGAEAGGELWIYDGSGVSRLSILPPNFYAHDLEILYGVAYISGSFLRAATGSTAYFRPAVMFYDGSEIGNLWEANDYSSTTISSAVYPNNAGPHPPLGVADGKLIFIDETNGNLMAYDPAAGGVSSVGSVAITGTYPRLVTGGLHLVSLRNTTTVNYYPSATYSTSGYVISSLFDFESSLAKSFRGIKIEFDAASDGDGGSVDIAYQVGNVDGSWTNLKTGATSGTEYTLSGVTGHAIAVKVTLNKGTSTKGPVLKSLNVRAAPQLQQFRSGTYIIDCTGTEKNPRQLRDGSYDTITGATLAASLLSTAKATSPFSVTDRFGTFTALVDLNDSEGFDLYEVHPPQDAYEGASYIARLKVREV